MYVHTYIYIYVYMYIYIYIYVFINDVSKIHTTRPPCCTEPAVQNERERERA